ncbi:MAG: sialate O-acetylesterase [Terrimicrobiaceae bacterium]
MKRRIAFLIIAVAAALTNEPAQGAVVLPPIISDHMVLQNSPKARIWGKADPGEAVSVMLGAITSKTTAGADGKWAIELDLSASLPGPFEMVVEGKNRIAIADVVVGEVWVASGQSNMHFRLVQTLGAPEEIAASANPMLRQFTEPPVASFEPLDECKGVWIVARPESAKDFTAVGYYFGKRLQKELQTAVGLISASWGGSPVEAWTSREALDTVPELKEANERYAKLIAEYPEKKATYVTDFGKWIADNAREDRPSPDVDAYAGTAVAPEGWQKVTLPGSLTAPGLPTSGVFWLRKEIEIDAKQANKPLQVDLGPMDGFEAIYWNGQWVKTTSYKDLEGQNTSRNCMIPAESVKEGKTILAVRVYAPVSLPKFRGATQWIRGEWLAKAEFEFCTLDAQQVAAAPIVPASPMPKQLNPGTLFCGMINPIVPYAIRGAIWYQGEANVGRAWQYRKTFPLMIQDWRSRWKQGDFPFYFCQLANFGDKSAQPAEANFSELREAQSETLKSPNTGQAVIIDLGEAGSIHPRNKQEVGDRLARIALAKDYRKQIAYSGPIYQALKIENGKIRLSFAHLEGGLVAQPVPATFVKNSLLNEAPPLVRNSPRSELEGFAICGEDKKWGWADAKIEGDTVLVWNEKVPFPVAVRYGWDANPTCNLYNQAGLPASPFRTDDFSATTRDGKY